MNTFLHLKNIEMKRIIIISLCLLVLVGHGMAKSGFAIVVDTKSYQYAQAELKAYAQAVEQVNGLKVYTVVDRWGIPDSIRTALQRLYYQKRDPIVGAVFVGDIPVPMIRNAQHLTSAFKMNQTNPRQESSVPSDRYYDDFSLQFKSVGHDEGTPYYYYSLTAKGSQRLQPNIYTGRIRPTDVGGTSRYAKLKAYLQKLVALKRTNRKLNNMFYFDGHGYISASKDARIDEKISYFEHFPQLKRRTHQVGYISHDDVNPVKERLMSELMRKDMDLAMLHHHGSFDAQYLNNLILPNTVASAKTFIMRNLREHIYHAKQRNKNADSLSTALLKKFDLPDSWVLHAQSDSLARLDSIYEAAADLHLEDFRAYQFTPNTPVVVIDACFCGSFHLNDCIANEYVFQPGNTVVCIANSVNALQDKWADKLIGLIADGGCVGDVVKYAHYLELHVIGDPTFKFVTEGKAMDVDRLVSENKEGAWRKLLKADQPERQCLAMEALCQLKAMSSAELLNIYRNSPSYIVRMQAFTLICDEKDDNFIKLLQLAANDSYELLQRCAVVMMGKSGDVRLIPQLISIAIANATSARINFDALNSLTVFPKSQLLKEFALQFDRPEVCYIHKDSVRTLIYNAIDHASERWVEDTRKILDPTVPVKKKLQLIRFTRNYMIHAMIPDLLRYLEQEKNEQVEIALLEAMGWRTHSYQRPLISAACQRIINGDDYTQAVKDEALKTYKRINE